jgi:hypothetical protein
MPENWLFLFNRKAIYVYIRLVFKKIVNHQCFCTTLAKIDEECDYNMDDSFLKLV